ncbi:uncharacterized protein LOC119552194 [Drosophila subpulchrella]|uniref:uncharacterized protein LOC119552194 n=1 Tax=Drosophila subpulchrella TaxID=1486046 RepID=UPI0018A1B4BB|nr:uncharacterized protein LOC119552194 [Drosophila subpulchrella]
MANNSTVRKVMQVSEESAPAVHIPIMVGNEIFVLTQQDVRRVEDVRILSYSRLGSNGQLRPVDSTSPAPVAFSLPTATTTNICTLEDLLAQTARKRVNFQMDVDHDADVKHPSNTANSPSPFLQPVSSRTRTVASVTTQLAWSKNKAEPEPVFPLCYSAGTSTSGLMTNTGCQHCPRSATHHSSCQTQNYPSATPIVQEKAPQNASCQTQTSPIVQKEPPQNSACQTLNYPSLNPIVKKEPPQNSACQTQSSSSPNPIVKKEPQNSTHQTQPKTFSTGCNTSLSHLSNKSSAESYTSDECQYTTSEESHQPCRHCKSQQTCVEQELMAQVRPQVQTSRCPPEQPCTSRQIHFDLGPQDRHRECFERRPCTQQLDRPLRMKEPDFYRSTPLSKTLYPRTINKAPDSIRHIKRNVSYEELQRGSRYKNSQQ